jgi:CBS domain-containing protein
VLVSAILEVKGSEVATIDKTATLGTAVADLVRHRVGALVVSPGDGTIDGIVSERDVVRCLSELHGDLLERAVSTVMSSSVHRCTPDDTVDSIMTLMTEERIRHVPVVRDGLRAPVRHHQHRRRGQEPHRRAREGPQRADGVHHRALRCCTPCPAVGIGRVRSCPPSPVTSTSCSSAPPGSPAA